MISHNMTWIGYPSKNFVFISPEEIETFIASQNIISRLMHCFIAFFVPIGLIAGICILIIFIKNYLKVRVIENLDLLLLCFTISNIIMIFFSFTVVPRPDYVKATHFACKILSFFFNLSYYSSQHLFILVLLIILLERFPSRTALSKAIQSPILGIGCVLAYAFCLSLCESLLLGTDNDHLETDCQLDPLFAWPEYEIIKLTFGFAIPSFLQIICFTVLLAKAPAEVPSLQLYIRPYVAVVAISITMFICRLFYSIMILLRMTLKFQRSTGTPGNELMMNIAEIVLFCDSCISLVFVLCLHKPCKDAVLKVIRNCKRENTTSNHEASANHESTPQ